MTTRAMHTNKLCLPAAVYFALATMLFAGLACSQATPNPTPKIIRLPTLTPTVGAAAQTSSSEIPVDVVAGMPESSAASAGANGSKIVMQTAGWDFAGLRTVPLDSGGQQLWGELLNNTSQPQIINAISGTFYNDQGQVMAGPESTSGVWPVNLTQPGERIPFKLTITDIQAAAHFELSVAATPSTETTRQDFQFTELVESIQAGDYCLTGVLKNLGGELQNSLVIGLVLYDDEDNVENFSNYNELYFAGVTGEQGLDFEICVPPPNQNVARYELQAWGQ